MSPKKKILVVEDDSTIARGLKDLLESEGYAVHTASRGTDAVSKGMKLFPELILLDVMLPDLNGFEVCRRLRTKGYLQPIIMLTAQREQVDKVIGLESGADDYVTKPFDTREVVARVRAHLRRSSKVNDTRNTVLEKSMIGEVMDNYQVESIIGRGGMGIVYKARDLALDRDVALKTMDPKLASDEGFLRRFKSEAKALAKLQNPNIVIVHALLKGELGFCIVMEYVAGETLAEAIRTSGALPAGRSIHIFKQILNALGHAHSVGVIHRDVKPSNVIITGEDIVKVTDFGLAKIQLVSGTTVTMGTGGTLSYMSPEQIRGLANVDHRGDIYSAGMALFETLAGKLPFSSAESDFTIREDIVHGRITPVDRLKPGLPKDLVRVVMKSIQKDPEDRFQTATEMSNALERFEKVRPSELLKASKESPTPTLQPTAQVPRKWMYGIGSIGIVIILGLALYLRITSAVAVVTITTEPTGALVELNGANIGETPIRDYRVGLGNLSVRIQKNLYVAVDTSLLIEANQDVTLSIPLLKLAETKTSDAMLAITTDPPGTVITLNGESVGTTPITNYKMKAGWVSLHFQKESYVSKDTSFVVDPGNNVSISISLEKMR